jgi:energy-coupling factor transporter ATP-binding protein EcfA2
VDEKEFLFRSGINLIVGSNGSGKTTIYKCIKHALGLSKEMQIAFWRQIKLGVLIGGVEYEFIREGGKPDVTVKTSDRSFFFRAKSHDLDQFYLDVFNPKFFIGIELASMFPVLEFCFRSDEERINSREIYSAFRLICGANDKLIATAIKEIDSLKSQLRDEEDFLSHLKIDSADMNFQVKNSLAFARKIREDKLHEKIEVVQNSIEIIDRLKIENENFFLKIKGQVEHDFSFLQIWLPQDIGSLKIEKILGRDTNDLSYGQSLLADFLLFLALLRASNFVDLNMPKLYVNDGLTNRRLDNEKLHRMQKLLTEQAAEDEDFQYVEFTPNDWLPNAHVVAYLDTPGRSL